MRDPVDKESRLEDWRLFILAESTHALDEETTPQESLAALIEGHPRSPIRAVAIRREKRDTDAGADADFGPANLQRLHDLLYQVRGDARSG